MGGVVTARTLQEQADLTPGQREALIRHGYDADALACGTTYRPPTRTWPLTVELDKYLPGTMLRSHVCMLDGVLIDGHEGSDLDPGGGCIHCRREWDEIDEDAP